MDGAAESDPWYALKREVQVQRLLGYDYVRFGIDDPGIKIDRLSVDALLRVARPARFGRGH